MKKADPQRVADYLEHILQAIRRIRHYTKSMNENDFLRNELIQDAVIRNLEIVGEAAGKIEKYHKDFANRYAEIPWHDIYLMRNRISHGYFQVDLEIVWKTLEKDLPELASQIKNLKH